MKRVSLLFLLVFAACASAEVNPIYARLKAFRTYVAIEKVDPRAHHFYVWFQDIEPCLAQVSGNSIADMEAVTEDGLHLSWGLFGLPPAHVDPVPDAMKPMADALLARVAVLHPDATRFKIMYAGDFRLVRVKEFLPQGLPGDPTKRRCAHVEASLKVMADGTVDGTHGMSMAGHGLLVHPSFEEEYVELPKFVDHVMPAALEGTSALYTPIFGRNADYQAAYASLCRKIVQAAGKIEAGTYQNPIEEVLAAQGETQLPPDYSTILEFSIRTYARHEDFNQQLGESPDFYVSARSAMAGPVTQEITSSRTGITYKVTMDLKARRWDVQATGPTGDVVSATYPINTSDDAAVIVEGNSVAVTGWVSAEIPEEPHGLTLPGANGYREFDVYPDASIGRSLVNLPEGPVLTEAKAKSTNVSRRIVR